MSKSETSQKDVKDFYDNFFKKLVYNYLFGNPRFDSALNIVFNHVGLNVKSVLDIGCGLGYSSFEMARYFDQAQVWGVDISDNLIKIAQEIFKKPNLKYSDQDITDQKFVSENKFDLVTMLDVYEHIPATERAFFHKSVADVLTDDGIVIFTCPTIHHQNYLRNHKPEGLQPVEEDITIKEVQKFADDLGAEVVHFSYRSVFYTNDYNSSVLVRNPEPKSNQEIPKAKKWVKQEMGEKIKAIEASSIAKHVTDELSKARAMNNPVKKAIKKVLKK